MKRILMTTAAAVAVAGTAQAGGIERSSQSVAILFEEGSYAELSFGSFKPEVSGVFEGPGAASSGDMAGDYTTYSLSYKQALSDKLDLAIVLDEGIGANVDYPVATAYPLRGSTASIDNSMVTALLRYKLENNFSVIGGLRVSRSSGEVALPAVGGYTMSTSKETDLGYVIGAAWEKPEIAARVALTYNSEITHNFASLENGALASTFETTIPESVNLEFQTGVAANTLLFGSIRWVHWTDFVIAPPGYVATVGDNLVDYDSNSVTYTLGLGRKFNDQWSGAAILGYEGPNGTRTGNLGPTDGFKSIALAATYQATDNLEITGAVRYVDINNARSNPFAPPGAPVVGGNFTGNHGLGVGIRIGMSF
jgi:long-subunit fatty acid transport protein